MEMLQNDQFQMGITVFSAMLFLVWILPGVVNRKGRFPEDPTTRKWPAARPRAVRHGLR
jgi:hypothetical protein